MLDTEDLIYEVVVQFANLIFNVLFRYHPLPVSGGHYSHQLLLLCLYGPCKLCFTRTTATIVGLGTEQAHGPCLL